MYFKEQCPVIIFVVDQFLHFKTYNQQSGVLSYYSQVLTSWYSLTHALQTTLVVQSTMGTPMNPFTCINTVLNFSGCLVAYCALWLCYNNCDRACENQPPEHKKCRFLARLLYYNLITIYTTATKSSTLLKNLMGFLLQLTEKGQCIWNKRYQRKYNSV